MSSPEQENKVERPIKAAPEQNAIGAPDAQAARNAGVSDLKAADAIRTNQSDGSLRKYAGIADQELSLELCYEGKIASRTQHKSERELLAQAPKEPLAEQSKTMQELESAAKTDPVAEVLLGFRRQAEAMKPGPEKEKLTRLAKEQAAELLAPRAIDDQESCGVHEAPNEPGKPLSGHVQYPDKATEGLRRLSPEDLTKLAKAFEVAGPAAEASIKETSDEILRRTGESYKDTVLCGINAVVGLLEYDRDLLMNPEKAREKAAGAGEVFGLLMYHGAVFSIKTGAYAETVRQSGDYSLPLKHLPQVLNKWYESQSPADQMAIVASVTGGLHLNQSLAEVQKLRQAGAFSAFLQEAINALPRNPEAERRAMEVLGGLVRRAEPVAEKAGAVGGKITDVVQEVPEKGIKDHIMEMSPYFEKGKKKALKGGSERAAEVTGLPEEQVKKLVKRDPEALERLTGGKLIYMEKEYREIYLQANPHYKNYSKPFDVHHRIPQDLLTRHPDWFSHKEIHGADNLVGIPRSTGAHKLVNQEWKKFWKDYPNATKQDLLNKVSEIDKKYGADYLP